MTSHRNCNHPATKAARAACRKAAASPAPAPAARLHPRDDASLPHAEKVIWIGENPFDRRKDAARYAAFEGYAANAEEPDSAFWVADLTAAQLTSAAIDWAESEYLKYED